jgi:hypothetical protein
MLKEPRKRTDKVFEDYNDYHDRGMIKWVTAYAMDELVKSISAGKAEAVKDIPILPQMSPAERKMVPSGGIQTKSGLIIQNLAHRTIVVFFERKAYTQEERERFLFS